MIKWTNKIILNSLKTDPNIYSFVVDVVVAAEVIELPKDNMKIVLFTLCVLYYSVFADIPSPQGMELEEFQNMVNKT